MFWRRKKKNEDKEEQENTDDGKNTEQAEDTDLLTEKAPEDQTDDESTEFSEYSSDGIDPGDIYTDADGKNTEKSGTVISSENESAASENNDRSAGEDTYLDNEGSEENGVQENGLSVDERLDEVFTEHEEEKKKGFFKKLVSGLGKTRKNISDGFSSLFSGFSELDDDFYDELEEILIMADIGVVTTEEIIDELKERAKEEKIRSADDCRRLLKEIIAGKLAVSENAYEFEEKRSVVLMVGVNGAGKTTTIGKLASQLKASGKKVILAAADTFRAAATEQLQVWADRAGVDIIANKEGTDPASVVYDSIAAAKARKADILICDTAGRLQNKSNLMKELEKINRIIDREYPEAYRETLIVLDATTGQNALSQAKQFSEVTDVTGIVLTKLDGTAKGGIVIAIENEMNIPVKYIGVGEGIDDLQKFDPGSFTEALFEN